MQLRELISYLTLIYYSRPKSNETKLNFPVSFKKQKMDEKYERSCSSPENWLNGRLKPSAPDSTTKETEVGSKAGQRAQKESLPNNREQN